MGAIQPDFAPVRPRVIAADGEEPRLLEEVVDELASAELGRVVWLVGASGAGKTTALEHLAAVFAGDERIVFSDDASPEEIAPHPDCLLIATRGIDQRPRGVQLLLTDWSRDELIEYLLAVHHDACGSVMARIGQAASRSWSPELGRVVLDRFAADSSATDPSRVIADHLREMLVDERQYRGARQFALAELCDREVSFGLFAQFKGAGRGRDALRLLRHEIVQLALAAEQVGQALSDKRSHLVLTRRFPWRLVQRVGQQNGDDGQVIRQLHTILASQRASAAHPMAASILHAADIGWRPASQSKPWNLAGGYFGEAQWADVDLSRGVLDQADFAGASLDSAHLDEASLVIAGFSRASLRGASLRHVRATGASFNRADLRGAKLTIARLERADFSHADLSAAALIAANLKGANLSGASLTSANLTQACLVETNLDETDFSNAALRQTNLKQTDLRTARLDGANLLRARLMRANLEDIEWPNAQLQEANLRGAHLTGSRLPAANLRGAILCQAGLGEIDWERADLRHADLRGATFHMGSSRSGLVFSPIAGEGSKTGFYTDDREEAYYRPPEEIRKANLRGADLRGAKLDLVDFYLVDLREARLDSDQFQHVRQSGAILSDSDT